MQDHDWNDLKYALSLYRAGSLAGAGRLLGVDETTVSRRLKALEGKLQAGLFIRNRSGICEATDIGLAVIERAERIECENALIGEIVGRYSGQLFGVVRITSVPMIVDRVLVPRLDEFRAANPGITVELASESRNLSLTRREADLALRLARPSTGGLHTKARRIGNLAFAVYYPASVSDERLADLEWIGYDEAHQHLPQARWLATADRGADRSKRADFPCLRVSDAETAREAVASGLGRTILPRIVADADPRLRRMDPWLCRTEIGVDLPVREVWLLSHQAQNDQKAVSAAKEWLSAIIWSADG